MHFRKPDIIPRPIHTKVPAILVEGGYVSNKEEGAKIHTPEYRQSLAEAIAGGLANYRKAVLSRNVTRQEK